MPGNVTLYETHSETPVSGITGYPICCPEPEIVPRWPAGTRIGDDARRSPARDLIRGRRGAGWLARSGSRSYLRIALILTLMVRSLRSEAGADDGVSSFSPVLDGVEDRPRRRRRFSAAFIPPGLRRPLMSRILRLIGRRISRSRAYGYAPPRSSSGLLARQAPTISGEARHADYSAWSGRTQRQTGLTRQVTSRWLPVRFFVDLD